MPDEFIQVYNRQIDYKGIFHIQELYDVIFETLKHKGYDRFDNVQDVRKFEEGITLDIRSRPERELTTTDNFVVKVNIKGRKLKEVDVTINQTKKKLFQGEISISFMGILYIDAHDNWAKSGFSKMLRIIAYQYVFKNWYRRLAQSGAKDVDDVFYKAQDYLNISSYRKHR
ncbi:MAG: hypothetical protein ACI8Y7_000650, partial [Candidatus Woesearchaeota archaeon]